MLGLLALLSATAPTGAQAAADGAVIFKTRCAACHSVAKGQGPVVGPLLAGVVGRKAGAVPAFNYSAPLKASNIMWTRPNLDKFLSAPTKLVPGTRMVIGVTDPAQRAALVSFLAKSK